jgi:O-antigen ligase
MSFATISIRATRPGVAIEVFPATVNGKRQAGGSLFTAVRSGLLAVLMAGPLAFGAVEAWAWGAMAVTVTCLLMIWAAGCVRAGAVRLIWSPFYVPALAFLALAAIQYWGRFTMDPIGTREAMIKSVMYILIFFLTQHLFVRPPELSSQEQQVNGNQQQARRATGRGKRKAGNGILWPWAAAMYVFAMATFAIIQFFASPGLLYGTIKPRWGGYIFGPYVSHNHYAGLMEMLIPIAAAGVLSLRAKHPARPFVLFAMLIAILSVFLSGSRGGTIALTVEFAIFAAVMLCAGRAGIQAGEYGKRVTGKVLAAASAVLVVAGLSFSWLDPGDTWKRWQQTANAPELAVADRITLAKDSLRLARQHLGYGVGLGAFEVAFPKYQTLVTDAVIDYAHNDYAQLAAEAGLLGWIVVPPSLVVFLWLAFQPLYRSSRSADHRMIRASDGAWLQLGAAIGVCGLLVHSLSDFNLHIPANAAWFAFCFALATPVPARKSRRGPVPLNQEFSD